MSYTQGNAKRRRGGSKRTSGDNSGFMGIAKGAAMGTGFALLCALALSLIFSALCMLYIDPATLTIPAGFAALYISSAAGGFICAFKIKDDKSSSLLAGGMCGALLFVLLGICSAALSLFPLGVSHGLPLLPSVLLRVLCVPASVLGAYLTTVKKRGIKGYRHRR